MQNKAILLILACALLVNPVLALAQQPTGFGDWSAVKKTGTNESIVVKTKDGKEIKGAMIEASDTTLIIDRHGKPFTIRRNEIRTIHVVSGKAAKGKWALIGAAIGAGAGAGIGATKVSSTRDDSEIYLPIGMLIGTGAGAVGGLLFGQGQRNRELIFSAY
ncbi:MAG: hypothetical protein ABR555_08365 [Pyrinomonadaceae bacterium]